MTEGRIISTTPAGSDADRLLSWENLGVSAPGAAFRQTLRELLFQQGSFFDRMATTGGLREPLTFFWILLGAVILMSFPLTLSHFALTAPEPAEVGVKVYNLHLLPPRVAGFLTVLLPLTLCAAAIVTVIQGTIFHLGARFFGARNWEGSVSIWCYARSAALAPIAGAEAIVCVISILAYLLALAWPAARGVCASAAHSSLLVFGAAAVLCSLALFLSAVVNGCVRSFRLPPEAGVAAAVAGVLLVVGIMMFAGFGFLRWGLEGGMITTGSSILIVGVVALTHRLAATKAGHGSQQDAARSSDEGRTEGRSP